MNSKNACTNFNALTLTRTALSLIGALCLLGNMEQAYAESAPYVGLGVTYTQPTTTKTGVAWEDSVVGGGTASLTPKLTDNSDHKLGGTLMAGYHFNPDAWGSYFLEGEVFGRLSNTEVKNSGVTLEDPVNNHPTTFSLSVKQKDSFGFTIKVGNKITEDLGIYLSAGLIKTTFETSVQGIQTNNIFDSRNISSSVKKNVWGNRLGGGLVHDFGSQKNLSIRLDYGYEKYRKYSTGNLGYFNFPGNYVYSVSTRPSLAYHVLTVSLGYKL